MPKATDRPMLGSFALREAGSRSPVVVDVLGRSYPHADNADDADWLNAIVRIDTQGFSARFSAYIGMSDVMSLRAQTSKADKKLKGSIKFEPLEPHLKFTGTFDPLGHLEWDVFAQHPVGDGATLEFNFESDQTMLRPLVAELDEIIEALSLIPEMREPTGKTWLVDPDG